MAFLSILILKALSKNMIRNGRERVMCVASLAPAEEGLQHRRRMDGSYHLFNAF